MLATPARFLASALAWALAGLVLGIVMAASEDHSQLATHAHMLVIGWVSFGLFSIIYQVLPECAATTTARLHFWLAQVSLLLLVTGLYAIFSGSRGIGAPLAIAGSLGTLASFAVFAWIVWPALRFRT